jgi:hypothetical protein
MNNEKAGSRVCKRLLSDPKARSKARFRDANAERMETRWRAGGLAGAERMETHWWGWNFGLLVYIVDYYYAEGYSRCRF